MTTPDAGSAHAGESAAVQAPPEVAELPVASDALDAARRALAAVDELALERHPEAFAHFDELLRAALEAPPRVASG